MKLLVVGICTYIVWGSCKLIALRKRLRLWDVVFWPITVRLAVARAHAKEVMRASRLSRSARRSAGHIASATGSLRRGYKRGFQRVRTRLTHGSGFTLRGLFRVGRKRNVPQGPQT